MSWWRTMYRNSHDEYEVTFASKYRERAKAVEKLCQMIVDKKVKSPDDVEAVVRCEGCKYFKRNIENDTYCNFVGGLTDPEEHDFCSYGERKDKCG